MKTLADLVERFQLYAVCSDCERMERLPVEKMIDRLGSDLTIDHVRRRLRCGGCGQRSGDIRIVYVGESARVSGFHYGAGHFKPELPAPVPASTSAETDQTQPLRSSMDSSVSPNPSTPT